MARLRASNHHVLSQRVLPTYASDGSTSHARMGADLRGKVRPLPTHSVCSHIPRRDTFNVSGDINKVIFDSHRLAYDGHMPDKFLTFDRIDEHILVVTMNRPQTRNALSDEGVVQEFIDGPRSPNPSGSKRSKEKVRCAMCRPSTKANPAGILGSNNTAKRHPPCT